MKRLAVIPTDPMRVYIDAGYSKKWLESWRNELTVTPEMIKQSIAYVAKINEKIVGFWCRSAYQSEEPTPGMLFIHPDHIGKGLGQQLFEAVKNDAKKCGIKFFLIEADPNAVPFYLKLGFEKIGEKESKAISGRMIPILKLTLSKE